MLDWVSAYLEQDEEIVVPVKKMWNEWRTAHAEPSLDDFMEQVLADDRFEEMGGVDHTEDMDDLSPEERDEYVRDMEAQGYFSGPRVKLKSREITLDHIARMIKKHNDRMENALRQARASMPEDVSEEEEGALIHIMELAKRFREHLREAGLEADEGGDGDETE
jgi:hypothetical protein